MKFRSNLAIIFECVLMSQVDIHKDVVDDMFKKCEENEQENLRVMSELFECTVDDLKICRCALLVYVKK